MVNITQDDLLKYLYNEGTLEKRTQIQTLLNTDDELLERLTNLAIVQNRLDAIKLISPSDRAVDNILNYTERVAELAASK
ncbi:hypothetical protein ACFOWM_07460 [Ferruginibacter yonginensis]|uniref:Uncharacterized protein n=1 Tax=Ferruginibacter yonginensis TaxID=1310416 RepID=A0ABV8QTJ5_9BACT